MDVRAVCDVFGDRTDKGVAQAAGAQPFGDHRRLLEVNGLEAVLIATPDHWHKAIAIDALNAGKDVYVEKPLTRLREEGPEIVRAARVNNRVCQVGMQQRSGEVYLEARERFVRSGLIGKISHVDCVWHGGANQALPSEPAQKPANLDWVRFLGPVKYRDWSPAQYLDFRAFLDFGGGKLTDFGAHWMDVVHMFMDAKGHAPLSAVAAGGVYYDFHDGRTAPDTISALFEYPGGFTVNFISLAVDSGPEYRGGVSRVAADACSSIATGMSSTPAEKGAQPVIQRFPGDITAQHVREFPGLLPFAQGAERGCVYRTPRRTGRAAGESELSGEAADSVRSAARGSASVFGLMGCPGGTPRDGPAPTIIEMSGAPGGLRRHRPPGRCRPRVRRRPGSAWCPPRRCRGR